MALRLSTYDNIFSYDYTDVLSAMIESFDTNESMLEAFSDYLEDDIETFKDECVEDDIMNDIVDKIPESHIDDLIPAVTKSTGDIVDVDEDEVIGTPLESTMNEILDDIITEGWGTFLSRMFPPAMVASLIWSSSTMSKLFKNQDLQKYLKKQISVVVKKYETKHKCKLSKKGVSFMTMGNISFMDNAKTWSQFVQIDGWSVVGYGDSDHIEQVIVLAKNEKTDKTVNITIPAPKKKDLGYYREWTKPVDVAESTEFLTEGWGMALASLTWPGLIIGNFVTMNTIAKIIKQPDMQKYIKKAIKDRVAKYQKQHPKHEIMKGKSNSLNMGAVFNKGNGTIMDYVKGFKKTMSVDGYMISAWGDTDHVENVGVWIYDKTEDETKLLTLPPPSKKELKHYFRREYSNPDDE